LLSPINQVRTPAAVAALRIDFEAIEPRDAAE
jgi:hypothetical protein